MTTSACASPLRLAIWKLVGAGNDFVAIDNREDVLPPAGPGRDALVHALCDRARGVGTDGALLLERPQNPAAADVRMRYHNRDGGEAEMCGNGARCLAMFAFTLGAAPQHGMRIETMAGIQRADVIAPGDVLLYMPDLEPPRETGEIEAAGWRGRTIFMRVGVPHSVIWIENAAALEAFDVEGVGRALRHHAEFAPAGTNANFACPAGGAGKSGQSGQHGLSGQDAGGDISPSSSGLDVSSKIPGGSGILPEIPPPQVSLHIRTYERGVECETLACGTGSVATAIAAGWSGRLKPPVRLLVRGGDILEVNYRIDPDGTARNVTLRGPARLIFRGETTWDPAANALTGIPV